MDKQRLVWIVLITAGAVMLGMLLLGRLGEEDDQPQSAGPAAAAPTSQPASTDRWQQARYQKDPANTYVAGSTDPRSGYLFEVAFDRHGAAVRTLKLAKTFATAADKGLYRSVDGDHAKYLAAVAADPEAYGGHYSLLNPAGKSRSYATRSIAVRVQEEDKPQVPESTVPLDTIPWDYQGTTACTQPAEGQEVTFTAVLTRNADPNNVRPALRLTKTYRLCKDDYSLQMRLKVENLSGEEMTFSVDQLGPTGVPREERFRGDYRNVICGKLDKENGNVQIVQDDRAKINARRKDGSWKVSAGASTSLGRSDDPKPALWLAQTNKFFGSIVYLRPTVESRLQAADWLVDFYYVPAEESATSRTHVTALRIGGRPPTAGQRSTAPALALKPQAAKEMVFEIFAGPKKRDMFANESAPHYRPLYGELYYLGTLTFRSCFCAWQPLTLAMMWLLQKISVLTLGNYGVAIMILVVLVRLVLHPLTKKGQVSMMRMQKLQPEMARLRKKYADDKEALQREMLKFHKEHGFAPFLGCLPMLIQMPIWISLWGSLNAAVELRHASFLPVWITDLAGPDELVSWGGNFLLPILGGAMGPIRSFNLLPLLLTVAMYLQTKLNPQMAGQPGAEVSPEQETQKKVMQVMMPAMMLLFFYNAASGLTLYIMTSTFAGVAEQYIIRKHIKAKEAAEAAVQTTVKVPGKAARGKRPKKPKGPFFIKRG